MRAGFRAPQHGVGARIRAVELQQHQQLRTIAREALRHAGLVEFDAVGGQVDLRDTRLGEEEVQHLPELRMQRRLSSGDLHRIKAALQLHQRGYRTAEVLHREQAVALGVRVADAAGEVAGVGHLHQHRAALVAPLVREVGETRRERVRRSAFAAIATAAGFVRRHVVQPRHVVRASPAVLGGQAVVGLVVLDHRAECAVPGAALGHQHAARFDVDGRGDVLEAIGTEAQCRLEDLRVRRQLELPRHVGRRQLLQWQRDRLEPLFQRARRPRRLFGRDADGDGEWSSHEASLRP
jgi:hypothetical protein